MVIWKPVGQSDRQMRRRQQREVAEEAHHAEQRRDEQPAVLQNGKRAVPDHVLDVVQETIRACECKLFHPKSLLY